MTAAGSLWPGGRGRQRLAHSILLVCAGLLAACGTGEAQAPAAATADETRAVEEAAAMLDEQRHADRPASPASPSPTAAP